MCLIIWPAKKMTEDTGSSQMKKLLFVFLIVGLISGLVIGYFVGGYYIHTKWKEYDTERNYIIEQDCMCVNRTIQIEIPNLANQYFTNP